MSEAVRPSTARVGVLLGTMLLGLIGVSVRLAYVQAVHSEEYAATARRQRVRTIALPSPRGAIYDRHGAELAISVPARTIYANPEHVVDPVATAGVIAPILGMPVGEIEQELRKDTTFTYLARRVGVVTGGEIVDLELPGIGVIDEARRLYPGGSLAAGVVGFIGTDQKGLAGLEYGYDELLTGEDGYRIHEQDPLGRRIPQGEFTEVPPVPGSDLVLTIDSDLQLVAERELARAIEETGAGKGMVVALDPRTGDILAMASSPTGDPNMLGEIDPDEVRNRVVTDAFEPGSVNKIVTASAALAEGVIAPDEPMWVPPAMTIGDKTFNEKLGGRSLDLRGILTQSSNLGTIRLAQEVGPDVLDAYFERFGYGHDTGLGFPGESAGQLPSAGRWTTSLPTMAIGQGLSVTTLQIAQAYAVLANEGVGVAPRLVSGWVDPEADMHRPSVPRQRRVIGAEVASAVRDMLTTVVEDGTGKAAAVPGYTVAGKTGTASRVVSGVGYQGHVATFVGMLPVEAPELVMAVVLDNPVPVDAGIVAAPMWSEIAKEAVRILRIAPSGLQAPPTTGTVPSEDPMPDLAIAATRW